MSSKRRRGLVRLGLLVGTIAALAVVALNVTPGSGGGAGRPKSTTREDSGGPAAPMRLSATISQARLPVALHGLAITPTARGILIAGGESADGASTDQVYRFDPGTGAVSPDGTLAQPLHDAAATTVGERTLVLGGGDTSTLDLVQALRPGGAAALAGRLPVAVSDLSAVPLAGSAYVLGGYDGQSPSSTVLQTTDGRGFTRVGQLPTPVRYTAAATVGDKVYAFGGELADGSDTADIQAYDRGTGQSVVVGHLPDPVSHSSAVALDGAIYVLGGRVRGAASDRILRFDPTSNAMVPAGRLPRAVFDGAAAAYGGRGYLLGGLGSGETALDTVIRVG